jgi:hypothetical protein
MAKKKVASAGASSRPSAKNLFAGRWRISWMERWDQEFVDEEVEGFFEFEGDGHGSFQFGYVRAQIDYQLSKCDGQPRLEFSFDGYDEMEPTVDGGQIDGMLFFYLGDESRFKAASLGPTKPRRRK